MPERALFDLDATTVEMRAAALRLMSGVSVFVFDHDLRLLMAEGGALRQHGYDPEDLAGKSLEDAIPPEAFSQLEPRYRATLDGRPSTFVYESADGTRVYRVQTLPVRHDDEVVGGIIYTVDISELERTRTQLEEAIGRFETAFTDAPIGMALVALDGTWLRVNPALCRLTGFSEDELTKLTFADITHPDDLEADQAEAARLLGGEIESYSMDKRYRTKTGDYVWAELHGSLVRDKDRQPLHFIAQVQDISERKKAEAELRRLAIEDPLTGLPNRRYFNDQVARQLDRGRRHGEEAVVLMIDIDEFKEVNDLYGHAAGDRLLCFFAEHLVRNSRKHDLVSRLGGDEFAVMKVAIEPGSAGDLARQTMETFDSLELELAGTTIGCGASVGWAVMNDETRDVDSVLKEADHSMYETKRRRRAGR